MCLCEDDAIKREVVPVHAVKGYGGSGSMVSLFLNLSGDELSDFTPQLHYCWEINLVPFK